MEVSLQTMLYGLMCICAISYIWLLVVAQPITTQIQEPKGLYVIQGVIQSVNQKDSVSTAKLSYNCSQQIRWYMPQSISVNQTVKITGFYLGDIFIVSKIE
jgi:hypothetical protein